MILWASLSVLWEIAFFLSTNLILFLVVFGFYLHHLSSNNPFGNNTNNKIPFLPFLFSKDVFGFCQFVFTLGTAQVTFGFFSLSHPDNAVEVGLDLIGNQVPCSILFFFKLSLCF